MPQRRLTRFFLAVALAALSACTTNEINRSVANYDEVKDQVKPGDSKQRVLALLEPTQANLDAQWKKVPDTYIDGDSTVEVYYFRSSYRSEGLVTDDQYTPYIFRDGILVGIGWAMLRGPMATAERDSAAATGKLMFNPYTTSQVTTETGLNTAADPQTFMLYGFHSVPCLSWTQARTDTSEDAFQYQAWATGFISGAGWRNAAIEQTDYAAINYYLDDYCKRYPTNDLFMATRALISRLKIRNR
jgi:hypothetical protein